MFGVVGVVPGKQHVYQVDLGHELLGELGLDQLGLEQLHDLHGDVVLHGGVLLGDLLQPGPNDRVVLHGGDVLIVLVKSVLGLGHLGVGLLLLGLCIVVLMVALVVV